MNRLVPVRPVHLPPYLLTPNFMATALPPPPHQAAHLPHIPHRTLMTLSLRKLPDTSRSSRRKRTLQMERAFQTDFEIFRHLCPSQLLFDIGNWIFNVELSEQRNQKVKRHADGFACAGQTPGPQIPAYTILAANSTG